MTPVIELGRRAKAASRLLAGAPTPAKNGALVTAADLLAERANEVRAANDADIEAAQAAGMAEGPLDRLRLTDSRLEGMANGLRTVAALADPIGEVLDGWRRPNGLEIVRTRVPLGVVAIIYENRPNVTSDAAGLCVKAGNAALLRGSSSALRSNVVVTEILRDALVKHGLPEDAVILVEDTSHETATEVMQLTDYVDCLIPRGGPALIQSVRDNAKVPVIIDGDGNCHVYVDAAADLDQALKIVVNAKTQRPSVCNAAESLVVHEAVADAFVPRVADTLHAQNVELVGDADARRRSPHIGAATDDDFGREYSDLKMSVAIVADLDSAIAHVNRYGTGHTEAILTRDLEAARRFTHEVDAAAVVVNASTRFTDGEEFGFGAEIGISTQKLHARGPMGLRELTTYKYIIWGEGQVRG
ncbi:MAG TPA: glutamate-5-semialdehyde dehydrogenase [Acidimicrobiia bacterium]|jgi:glutamate-5-semialdehyde dehydrogenase|nr:glutamate-5-semialdehyde dehydrogenase [Acidimicrobiia bacterium]